MHSPRCSSLYQVNTRVWLTELSHALGRPTTLDDIPDVELDRLVATGFRLGLVAQRLADRSRRAARLPRQPCVAQRFQETRTWGRRAPPFWPAATRRVRESVPGFSFVAKVYWDLKWTMQPQGFDYAYDKRLDDRLRDGYTRPVREHLHAGVDDQGKLARFLENHDEPRVPAILAPGMHQAAAIITYLSPGLRFFHQGQFEGRKEDAHFAPRRPCAARTNQRRAPAVLRPPARRASLSGGSRRRLEAECTPAWKGNWTWDCFVAWLWTSTAGDRRLVAVNYAANQSQCHVRLPPQDPRDRPVRFEDLMGAARFDRDRHDLDARGLYLDMPAWGYHVFDTAAIDQYIVAPSAFVGALVTSAHAS